MATGSKVDMTINLGTIVALVALVTAGVSGFYSWRMTDAEKYTDFANRLETIEQVLEKSPPDNNARSIAQQSDRLHEIESAIGSSSPASNEDNISKIEKRIETLEQLVSGTSPVANANRISTLKQSIERVDMAIRRLPVVPPNVVVASTQECTGMWEPYSKAEGRFILGVGRGELPEGVISGQEGGSPFIMLTEEHLPYHKHATIIHADPIVERGKAQQANSPTIGWGFRHEVGISTFSIAGPRQWKKGTYFLTGPTGKDARKAHLPVFVALHFCKLRIGHTGS